MRINDSNSSGISSSELARAQQAEQAGVGGKARGVEGRGAGRDSVQLSELADELRRLAADGREREAHLERLAAEVGSGRYRVEATKVSRRLVADAVKIPR